MPTGRTGAPARAAARPGQAPQASSGRMLGCFLAPPPLHVSQVDRTPVPLKSDDSTVAIGRRFRMDPVTLLPCRAGGRGTGAGSALKDRSCFVTPAKAGVQRPRRTWIPAFRDCRSSPTSALRYAAKSGGYSGERSCSCLAGFFRLAPSRPRLLSGRIEGLLAKIDSPFPRE